MSDWPSAGRRSKPAAKRGVMLVITRTNFSTKQIHRNQKEKAVIYLFVPFTNKENNRELLSMGTRWVDNVYKDPRGKEPPKLLFYNPSLNKPLNIINQNDTLYVLAHGHRNMPGHIANVRSVDCLAKDHIELASILKVAGLPDTHRRVKLYVCNGSGQMRVFASRFKRTMQGMGYTSIDVYCYDSSVGIPVEFSDGQYHKDGIHFDVVSGSPLLTSRFRASEVRYRVP